MSHALRFISIYWLSLVVSSVIFVLLVVITLKAMRNEDFK
jgi:hypothetical protein